ncbi:MAG: LptF/LptG family permease [Treponema sp.]|nr:LptF/LptG family permease [Treponema sp.]
MKLVFYLFRKTIPLFVGAIFFFAFVLCLVDLMMNLWNYISNGVPVKTVGLIMLYYVPKTIWYATPIALLFAVSYALSDFYAQNELLAVFASGISLTRFTFPVLIFSFLLSFGLFWFDDNVVVRTYGKKSEMQELALNKEVNQNSDKVVVISENGNLVYKADFYNDSTKRLITFYAVVRNEDKTLNSIVRADSAVWDNDHWRLSGGVQYKLVNKTFVSGGVEKSIADRLNEPPQTFRKNVVSIDSVNSRDARTYIEHLQRAGLPYAEALSIYYKKFAFPFILFIVVFLSVGLSGKTRKNVMLMSLASCITGAVLFYVTQMITMLLAKFEYISPFMGAWFPVFLFVVIAIVLLRFART